MHGKMNWTLSKSTSPTATGSTKSTTNQRTPTCTLVRHSMPTRPTCAERLDTLIQEYGEPRDGDLDAMNPWCVACTARNIEIALREVPGTPTNLMISCRLWHSWTTQKLKAALNTTTMTKKLSLAPALADLVVECCCC